MTELTARSICNRATVLASLPLSILLALAISGCSSESVDDNKNSVDTDVVDPSALSSIQTATNNTSSNQPRADQTSASEEITALPFTKKVSQNGQQRPLSAFPVETNDKQLQKMVS